MCNYNHNCDYNYFSLENNLNYMYCQMVETGFDCQGSNNRSTIAKASALIARIFTSFIFKAKNMHKDRNAAGSLLQAEKTQLVVRKFITTK